jgi:hypothetical protein
MGCANVTPVSATSAASITPFAISAALSTLHFMEFTLEAAKFVSTVALTSIRQTLSA